MSDSDYSVRSRTPSPVPKKKTANGENIKRKAAKKSRFEASSSPAQSSSVSRKKSITPKGKSPACKSKNEELSESKKTITDIFKIIREEEKISCDPTVKNQSTSSFSSRVSSGTSRRTATTAGIETTAKDGGGTVAATPGAGDSKPEEVSTHCVVGGAHAFILRISSFFGLAPLKFESQSNGFTVTISNAMCIYSYILVTILVIFTIFGLATEINVGVELSVRMSSRMSQVVSTCDVLVVVATAGAGVYGAPRRMKDMLKFMDSVALVDNSIGAQYSIVHERKLCAVLLAILVFFTVLITDDFCFYVLQAKKFGRQWDIVTNYISFYLLWYVVMVLELQFAFTALSVRKRFRAVNDAIALTAKHVAVPLEKLEQPSPVNMFAIRVAPVEPRRSASNVSLLVDSLPGALSEHPVIIRKNVNGEPRLIVPPCEAIRRLAVLHGALCEVVKRIDKSYGLPLIVILLSTLLHLIVTPYFLIMEIIVSTNRIHFLVLQFFWCVIHMLRMFVVVEPCHYTITEGKRTEELVCQIMTYAPSGGALPSRLELFSRQLMLRSVTYSPLGMCTLDRPLVASVIGAVTTYLVILIQFQRYDS